MKKIFMYKLHLDIEVSQNRLRFMDKDGKVIYIGVYSTGIQHNLKFQMRPLVNLITITASLSTMYLFRRMDKRLCGP
ncbi:hypothetical protein BKM15_26010 [Pseudomonas syringae pv. syringae]|nr:hypothetical protein BKM15_26010 [Pseudomonas syringae pv. syringae]